MRLLICGGRNFNDKNLLVFTLNKYIIKEINLVATGGATGADTLGIEWALSQEINCRIYPAKWNLYGRSAGPKRNYEMFHDFKPDYLVAFPGGKGTHNMISIAKTDPTCQIEIVY